MGKYKFFLLYFLFFYSNLFALNLAKLKINNTRLINSTTNHKTIKITVSYENETEIQNLNLNAGETKKLSFLGEIVCAELDGTLLPVEHSPFSGTYDLYITEGKDITVTPEFGFIPNYISFKNSVTSEFNKYVNSRKCRSWKKPKELFFWKNNNASPREYLDFIVETYEKNNFSKVQPGASLKIPKIIHQIYFSNPIPEKYQRLQESWKKFHPDWTYIIWNYDNIKELGDFPNKDYFDKSDNFAEKTDILRYVLLEKFGGVYADMDCECFEPFDVLHQTYDFYTCTEFSTPPAWANLALVGCKPGHPIIKACLENIRKCRYLRKENDVFSIVYATGPAILSKSIWTEACKNGNCDIVFPSGFFCPPVPGKILSGKGRIETFSVHYFAGGWL